MIFVLTLPYHVWRVKIDAQIRRIVYDGVAHRGAPPSTTELMSATSASSEDVRASLQRLAASRVLVLQPSSGEILMAPPFSAVPTPFVVETAKHRSYANCMWDALGVPIMLRTAARITTSCGCCGEQIAMNALLDEPPEELGTVHFAVPAAKWWDNIVFT